MREFERECHKCAYMGYEFYEEPCYGCLEASNFKPRVVPQSLAPSERDMVNHPQHYTSGAIEVIDIIESVVSSMDLNPVEAALTAQVVKYICRWKNKGGAEDLKKCQWYLDRLIKKGENDGANKG